MMEKGGRICPKNEQASNNHFATALRRLGTTLSLNIFTLLSYSCNVTCMEMITNKVIAHLQPSYCTKTSIRF